MMSKITSTLTWSAVAQTYTVSGPQNAEARSLVPDSPAWFAWLAEVSSFAFHGQAGSYTARQEAVQRGGRYWYAYRHIGQKLTKKYLGKTTDLTVARMEQAARTLHPDQTTGVSPRSALSAHQGHRPKSETVITPAPAVEGLPEVQTALPADLFISLLSTKLHVPRLPARLVHRSRLIERLQQGLKQTLILLCAPAGFGKTTLLTEFLAERTVSVAWLSLDAEDNDPLRFLSALLAALQTCDPTLGASTRAFFSVPHGLQRLSLSAVFALLLSEVASRDVDEFLLILDDYHVIMSEPIEHAMAFLVEHCPPNLHLVIATRADPFLPLSRLRVQGQLCEVRAADLQFDSTEASHFLHMALERDLESSTIAIILHRTEGWVAGLQLTALSLHGRRSEAEVQQFLADSGGSQRYLVDYLVEEVLAHQPEAVQSFLLHTSLLEPFSASLCAAVTGGSMAESTTMLAALERANLFLLPVDEHGEWYRYHHLWAAVLRVLLVRQLGASGVATLYGRASHWYEQHDLPSEAIEATLKAGEFERATQLVEQLSPLLLARSRYYTLRRWIEHLPQDLWTARPIVCLAYAWTLVLSGAHAAAAGPLQEAERLFQGEENNVGLGMVAALRALVALLWADGHQALTSGRRALTLLPTRDLLLRSVSMSVVGGGYWLVGEVEAAWQTLVEARTLHERTGNVGGLLVNSSLLGNVLALQGKLHEAAECYQQVMETVAESREYAIEASIRQASIFYEWNACTVAEAQVANALAESSVLVGGTLLGRGVLSLAYGVQARIRQARGEQDAASALFTQAVTLAQQQQHPRLLAQAQAAQVRWWLAQGQIEAVTRWRDEWANMHDAMPTYEDEPGALTLARVLLAQGEPDEALRLLDGFRTHARSQGRLGSELEILVLCALALTTQGQTGEALRTLQQALVLAEPEGYVRLFADEGVPMASLLHLVQFRGKGKHGATYVRQLLTVLEAEHPEHAGLLASLMEPLSRREYTILRELAAGRSMAEMAEDLVVSPNTIKTQVSSLYRKLNTHSREEALAEAVRLHLL